MQLKALKLDIYDKEDQLVFDCRSKLRFHTSVVDIVEQTNPVLMILILGAQLKVVCKGLEQE